MNLDDWGADYRTIKGNRMRISFMGNIIMPTWGCPWGAKYKRKPPHWVSIHKGKPIPDNVIYLEQYRQMKVEVD